MRKLKTLFLGGDKRTKTAKKNILGSFLIKGISILVQLLLVPLTLNYLSDELYGVWITLSSIIIWMSFFDVGLTLGLKNKLAEALAQKDYDLGKKLVSTTYIALIFIFIPLGIIGEIAIPCIQWCSLLNIPSHYSSEIKNVIQVIFACVCLQMIFNAVTSVLAAYQKVALSSIFHPIGNLISLIIIFILTKTTQPSLMKLVLSVSYIPLIVLIIGNIAYFRGPLKAVCPSIGYIRLDLMKSIFSLGIGFFFLSLQYILIFQSTNFLISYVSSPIFVTQYSIAYRYLSVTLMVFGLVLNPFWPAFTDAYVKKDFTWMRRVYRRLISIYFIAVIGLVCMVLFSPWIYGLWIGNQVEIPIIMTISVAIFLAINSWNSLQSNLLNGIGAIRVQVIVSAIGLIIFIPLSLYLGQSYGAIGIVHAITIVSVVYAYFYTRQMKKLLG
ncbi:lipopolysaccharide biosynthesis protein [uncultured Duncaniella sp.]|uniref:lipopolysaccharide biosynthesis protein n=1 Tax=uncultured Duncaniella sp. TaxID=2768039 RepID=UPI00262BAFD3|nr:oligosaccharide flippase family protein [uncultured Duncaniella sp.]